ncbi:hypothetical protein A3H53_01090 [Candidatus Nomurabacteria bacterium RIFCSPLOWO2_02_FULL_40_10]|uniref:Uncharacterized protein n=1 Tax=Candidatus Nomurabacteria bacterium RIFCSPLOWO2_02_FULL_40_10 TaxID=1801786 RepID=A0A1F6XY80_9BACT|nr:MAG: hypothetical protein A3H53_01090 [Candidatus Nomurabacteria bacterium RIFCSPLOWO2_02_FULL_40_10]OGZ72979.1 MAG: hypothetical protein A3A98_03150 [Candidatus Staskawiczbacteria bacterium RIFCSPLOWO2_01_FULL_40_39]
MIDLTTISLLRIKSLINTPEKCEIFHRYTPLLVKKGISPKEILGILTKSKEEKDLEETLKNLFGEKAGP